MAGSSGFFLEHDKAMGILGCIAASTLYKYNYPNTAICIDLFKRYILGDNEYIVINGCDNLKQVS